MMSKLSRDDALENISNWSKDDVLLLLRKYNLEECCQTFEKRQINGDSLLHLTEGKLALWKNDLSRPAKWKLWSFIEELKKSPEQYIEQNDTTNSDTRNISEGGSWDSEFDDEDESDFEKSSNFNDNNCVTNERISIRTSAEILENTYANCDIEENKYENLNVPFNETNTQVLPKPQDNQEKSLAEQLREQLLMLKSVRQSTPKLETTNEKDDKRDRHKIHQPRTSFLHTAAKASEDNGTKRIAEPKKNNKKPEEVPAKVVGILRNFDLLANLPTKTEESEDEYESFEQSTESISKIDSKLSITSNVTHNSADNIYHPNSLASHDDEGIDEIYESIKESPEDAYKQAGEEAENCTNVIPPPLPPKPPLCSSLQSLNSIGSQTELVEGLGTRLADEVLDLIIKIKRTLSRSHLDSLEPPERSPDKKSVTQPHSSSITLPIVDRSTRPLPIPPDRHSYMDKLWFHNVTREQATILIKEQSTYGNSNKDGYFLLRPSITNPNNPLALVLWYKDRVYNVPVRKRTDNRFALGSAKPNEQSFGSVEDMILFYKREDLILYTGGIQMGSTKLTDTPPK